MTIIFITLNSEKNRLINLFLDRKTEKFELAYKNIYETKEELADFIYRKLIVSDKFINIYSKVNNVSKMQQKLLREELYLLIKSDFEQFSINKKDTIHFHLKNNHSFLRMHKPLQYGDDLSDSREMVVCVNKCLKKVSGFEQGKILSAYRFIYPIIINKKHLGSMEITFSINNITTKLMKDYNILSNFFLKNNVLNKKLNIQNLSNFTQSTYDGYCYNNDLLKLIQKFGKKDIEKLQLSKELNKEILEIVNNGKNATIYSKNFSSTITVIPIWNKVSKQLEGFIKIREFTKYIYTIHIIFYTLFSILLIVIFLVLLYIYNQNKFTKKIALEKQLVQNILNSLSNITFVTNFKTLEYANVPFLNFFGVKSIEEFNKKFHNINHIFLEENGYLYQKNNMKIEQFTQLIIDTDTTRRKVKIFNSKYEIYSFLITISNVKYNKHNSYLLSLTDITQEEVLQKEMEKKAYYDSLTNIYNRNKFNELFEQELKKVTRYKRVFSLAIIDIDKFKNFNDTYGHLIGDEVLVLIANTVKKQIRETDVFARWGGEEFIILFSDINLKSAYLVCEKLRIEISNIKHEIADNITVSIGISQYKENDTIQTIFKRADESLYKAKQNGRNKVEINDKT